MRFQSKNLKIDEFSPIQLATDFPVSPPDHSLRGEKSPIGPHVHDCFEIGFCYEGNGIFLVENKILPFQAGDAVVINQQELHVVHGRRNAPARWDFINLLPNKMLAEYVCEEEYFLNTEKLCGPDFNNIIFNREHPDICSTIKEIIREVSVQQKGYRSLTRALVWTLLVKLHRIAPKTANKQMLSRKKMEQIKPALGYIIANYGEVISIEDLAERCNTSMSNLRKLFHAALGTSPQNYIKNLRLKAIAVMLSSSNKAIEEIAFECGYPTLSNFNRHFKEFHGRSPRKYRLKTANNF